MLPTAATHAETRASTLELDAVLVRPAADDGAKLDVRTRGRDQMVDGRDFQKDAEAGVPQIDRLLAGSAEGEEHARTCAFPLAPAAEGRELRQL